MVVTVWQRREPVLEAYTDEREPVQFEFDGLAFETERRADLGPSPLRIPAAPDTSTVDLLALDLSAGGTGSSIPTDTIPSGSVTLSGRVLHDGVPLPAATVRLELHQADPRGGSPVVASADLLSDEGGNWTLTGVAGGRWRARAFVPEQLASVDPFVQFVVAGTDVSVDLVVASPDPSPVLRVTAPPTLYVGESGTVALTAGTRRVDADGVIMIDPHPGASVTLTMSTLSVSDTAILRPISALVAATNGNGAASFGVTCDAVGTTQGTFDFDGGLELTGVVSARLPDCVPLPPPPEPESGTDAAQPDADE